MSRSIHTVPVPQILRAQCNLIWPHPSLSIVSPEPHSGGPANGTFNLRFFSLSGKEGWIGGRESGSCPHRRKVKFCLFAEALSLPPACSIKRAPISAAYLVISPPPCLPRLSSVLTYSSLLHSLLICPPAPPSLFLHHQSLPFLHGIPAMQSRSCPPAPAPALFPSSSPSSNTLCHAVFIQIATAPETQEMHLHRQRSGIQPLGTLPRSIPPAPWCTCRLIQCFAGTFWRDWIATRLDLVTGAVFGGEGENTKL